MWKFIKSATNQSNWNIGYPKEICFMGRSNVGKSSLINALSNQKIAKISNTPGRTQLINYFEEEGRIYVDLPGYGYAKMPKDEQRKMLSMIEDYIINKKEIVKVFLLIDSKVGPTKDDFLMINFLKSIEKNFMLILTKSDKSNQSQRHKTELKIKQEGVDFISVSSRLKKNINILGIIIKKAF